MTKISKTGTMSYKDLKTLDIYEFFLVLTNIEQQNKTERDAIRD